MGDTKLWETRSKWQRRSVIDVKNNEKEGKDLLPNVDLFFVQFCVCFAGGVKKEIGHRHSSNYKKGADQSNEGKN